MDEQATKQEHREFQPKTEQELQQLLNEQLYARRTCPKCLQQYIGDEAACPLCVEVNLQARYIKLGALEASLSVALADIRAQRAAIFSAMSTECYGELPASDTLSCNRCNKWLHNGFKFLENMEAVCEACCRLDDISGPFQAAPRCHHDMAIPMCTPCRVEHQRRVGDALKQKRAKAIAEERTYKVAPPPADDWDSIEEI